MEIDKTTLEDLSIFNREELYSIFHHLDFTRTVGGRLVMRELFMKPLSTPEFILSTQATIKYICEKLDQWPMEITNGTLMVMEKFLDAGEDPIPQTQGPFAFLNSLYYRTFFAGMYSLIRYSLVHFNIFLQGFEKLIERFNTSETPQKLKDVLTEADLMLKKKDIREFMDAERIKTLSISQIIHFGHTIRHRQQHTFLRIMDIYHLLDAWYGLAKAVREFNFSFPEFITDDVLKLEMKGLFHPLLKEPVDYDVIMNESTNFLFLTGANMAGKSTFIKAIGVAVFLAHIGMGVPAKKMELSFFDGILSNIQVQDNIFLGESYFFNEVQRIKKTILKINDNRRWLILIDEMFKGTNFQDAQNCSTMVIKGLLNMKGSLFILSTHLYEIADNLKSYPNISFKYFETFIEDETPRYSYKLKEGISNDRLGFLILKREKVLDLLKEIK